MKTAIERSRRREDDFVVDGEIRSRRCSKCRDWKPIDDFKARACRPGIRERVCRPCLTDMARDRYQTDPMRRARQVFEQRKSVAKRNGLPFDITFDWFRSKIENGVCDQTGLPFDMSCDTKAKHSPSIDQIVPGLGYVEGNVQVVVMMYNIFKGTWSDADMLEMARALVAKHDAA